MEASDILERAAELLDERGWTRGEMENAQGCLCALGAMRVAAHGDSGIDPIPSGFFWRAKTALDNELGYESTTRYNDFIAKDKRYVQRKMRRAAKNLKAQGR